jgi:hypothetical protein
MLEYLDTIDSDSDFILESDIDYTSEEENTPHATPPASQPVSDSEEDAYALFYIMWCSSRAESSSYRKLISKFTEKYSLSYRLGDKKRRPKSQFHFLPKLCKF